MKASTPMIDMSVRMANASSGSETLSLLGKSGWVSYYTFSNDKHLYNNNFKWIVLKLQKKNNVNIMCIYFEYTNKYTFMYVII